MLKIQHDRMKQRYIKKMEDEIIEGEVIKKKALEAQEKHLLD